MKPVPSEIITENALTTQKIGRILAEEIVKSHSGRKNALVIGLEGELGSGKTTFIQGMAKGLGLKEPMTSPTFVIMRRYQIPLSLRGGRQRRPTKQSRKITRGLPRPDLMSGLAMTSFFHIDCYRINQPKDLLDLDFKEILSHPRNIVVIEWAEKVKKILPANTLWIRFEHLGENKRRIFYD